jgi:hypothetical protein
LDQTPTPYDPTLKAKITAGTTPLVSLIELSNPLSTPTSLKPHPKTPKNQLLTLLLGTKIS